MPNFTSKPIAPSTEQRIRNTGTYVSIVFPSIETIEKATMNYVSDKEKLAKIIRQVKALQKVIMNNAF